MADEDIRRITQFDVEITLLHGFNPRVKFSKLDVKSLCNISGKDILGKNDRVVPKKMDSS